MRATGGDNSSSADDDEVPAVDAPALAVKAAAIDEAAVIEEAAAGVCVCACVGDGCDTSLNGVSRTGDGGGCASVRDSAAESTAKA
jgi:hypothetical protein